MNREISVTLRAVLAVIAVASLAGCTASPDPRAAASREDLSKIKFDLQIIHPDGLRGPPDGLVSVSYYFWVPADERIYQEIRRIDPSVEIRLGATDAGRAGSGPDKTFCLGNTSQPHWRDVLSRLSALSYVNEIRECFFER